MRISGGVWARHVTVWTTPPKKWHRFADTRNSPAVLQDLKTEFLTAPPCNLDSGWSLMVREGVSTIEDFDSKVLPLIQARSPHVEATNMGSELGLNRLKRPLPAGLVTLALNAQLGLVC